MPVAHAHHPAVGEPESSSASCPTCEIAPFARNNYFTGKLMLERDFTDEQRFHIDKLRLHNQRLHGWGVVCGLLVLADNNPACRDRFVTVTPGLAIDCCGHEIIVREPVRIDITRLPSYAKLTGPGAPTPRPLQLCIRYRECGAETIPVLYDDCAWDTDRCAPNRILESFEFDLLGPDAEVVRHIHGHALSLGVTRTIGIDRATRLFVHAATDRMYVATRPLPGSNSAGDLFQLALGAERILSAADLRAEVRGLAASADGKVVYVLHEAGDVDGGLTASIDQYDAAAIDDPPLSAKVGSALGDHAALVVTPAGTVVVLADNKLIVFDQTLTQPPKVVAGLVGGRCLSAGNAEVLYVGCNDGVIVSLDLSVQPLVLKSLATLVGTPSVLDISVVTSQPAGGGSPVDDLVALTDTAGIVVLSAGVVVGSTSVALGSSQLATSPDGKKAATAGTAGAQVINLAHVRAGTASVPPPLAIGPGIVDGQGDLVFANDLVYVAYPGLPPEPGSVAVLDVTGSPDCDDLLWKSMETCPSCDDPGCIVLATMQPYRPGSRLVDKGTAPHDDNSVKIDNRLGRSLLPSTQTLAELIECLIDRPMGGTGRDGADGQPGKNGTDGKDGQPGPPGQTGADGNTGPAGEPGPPGEGLEAGLVRINRISWLHRQPSAPIKITHLDGKPASAFAIGFTDGVQSADLDDNIFRVLFDHTTPADKELEFRCLCEVRGTVVPIKAIPGPGDRIVGGQELPPGSPTEAIGFILSDRQLAFLKSRPPSEIRIELHGDFVLDVKDRPRAIDAEFVRASFPTGDHPEGAVVGVQGGVFESWFPFGVDPTHGVIGANLAAPNDLAKLPGVTVSIATRIAAERAVTPFVDSQDFFNRVKPTQKQWALMREHLDFTQTEE